MTISTGGSAWTSSQGTLWGASNDGSGSGLDADLLDGQQSSYYAAASHGHDHLSSPWQTIDLNTIGSDYTLSYEHYSTSSSNKPPTNDNANAVLTANTHSSNYRHQIAFSSDENLYHRAQQSGTWFSWNKIWSAGNDGSGSGLDADTVDGLQGSSFLRSNTSDTMSGNLTIDNGTSTAITVISDDSGESTISLYGSSQGTGRLYVGQSTAYGGGIEYNGDNSPGYTGAGADYITLFRRSNNVVSWTARNIHSGNDWQFRGNVTAYASDERLKENVQTITGALDKVCKLRGVTFDWKDDCEDKGFMPTMKHETGVIAQEVQAVIPDAAVPAPFDDNYLTVKHEKIIPVLIEAIKELKSEVDDLKQQLEQN